MSSLLDDAAAEVKTEASLAVVSLRWGFFLEGPDFNLPVDIAVDVSAGRIADEDEAVKVVRLNNASKSTMAKIQYLGRTCRGTDARGSRSSSCRRRWSKAFEFY